MRSKIGVLAIAFLLFTAAVCTGEPGDLVYVGCFKGTAEKGFTIGFVIQEIAKEACLTECVILDGIMATRVKFERNYPVVRNGQLTNGPFSGSFISESRFEGTYNSIVRYSPVRFVADRVPEKP